MTLKEVNEQNNKILAQLVDRVPDMTALELKTYKELILKGDFVLDGDDGGDIDSSLVSALISSCGLLKSKIYHRLKNK